MANKRFVELTDYLHPGLKTLDYSHLSVKFQVVGLSLVAFCIIYVISHVIASLTSTYRNLRIKEKIFWNLAVVRAAFGVLASVAGSWALFTDTPLDDDVVFATTQTSYLAICVSTGFFLFEVLMLLASDLYYRQANMLLNLHHWLALCGYGSTLLMGSTHYFAMKGLILEMSTPFSALCWTLLKCGQERTLLWKANQFLLVHLFHCRSVVECYFWYVSYTHWSRIWAAMPTVIFVQFYLSLTMVSLVMTPYWAYKKTAQMINPVDWNFENENKSKETNGNLKSE